MLERTKIIILQKQYIRKDERFPATKNNLLQAVCPGNITLRAVSRPIKMRNMNSEALIDVISKTCCREAKFGIYSLNLGLIKSRISDLELCDSSKFVCAPGVSDIYYLYTVIFHIR